MALKRTFFGKTDIGRKRQINEDSYYCSEMDSLCIVADGMGGHSFGEIASKMAVDNLRSYVSEQICPLDFRGTPFQDTALQLSGEIQKATAQANEAIFGCLKTESSGKKMGTTLVAVYFLGNRVFVAHVGDSRCYLFRKGRLKQITEDHTIINRWLKVGQISEAQAEQYRNSPNSKYVTRALGTKSGIKADIGVHRVYHNDLFLLCTDGLTDLVRDEEIAEILLDAEGSLSRMAKTLISMANGRGGKDNITIVLAHLVDTEVEPREETEVFYRKPEPSDQDLSQDSSDQDPPTEVFVRKGNQFFQKK